MVGGRRRLLGGRGLLLGGRLRVGRVAVGGQRGGGVQQLGVGGGRGGRRVGLRLGLRHGQGGRRRGQPAAQHCGPHRGQSFPQEAGAGLHRFLRLGLLALHLLVLDGVEVDLADAVHHILVLEGDETESAMALRLLVHEHDGLFHLAELVEVGLDLLRGGVLADAAHEDLLGLVGLLGPVLGRGVLGVDLLAVQRVDGHLEHVVHAVRLGEGDEAEAAAPLQHRTKHTRGLADTAVGSPCIAYTRPGSRETTANLSR